MKLKKLEIRNIASIESATIDFSSPRFTDESIFLIYGETGSGKSTILDAICLALYKKTPRLETASGNDYVDEAFTKRGDSEVVSKTDAVEQYIRRGIRPGEDCYSELSFTANDGLDYVARLQFNIKSTGNIGTTEWTLTCPDGSVLHGKGQSNAKEEISDKVVSPFINKLVGLTYKQFCRTTMLAQGEFTKLLKASEAERCQILEKITDTGRYKTIGLALTDRQRACKNTLDALRAQLSGVPAAAPGQEEALQDEKWEKTVAAANLAMLSRFYHTQEDWIDRDEELEGKVSAAQREYEQAKDKVDSPLHQAQKKDVDDWSAYEAERQAVSQLIQIDSEQNKAVREQSEMNAEYTQFLAGLRWLESDLKNENKAAKTREAELSSLEKVRTQAQDALAGFDLTQLNRDKNEQEQIKRDAQAVKEALVAYQDKQKAKTEKETEIALLKTKETEAQNAYDEKQKAWKEAENKTAEAKDLYEQTMARLGHAKALMAELKDGDECPVCHNIYHALDTDDILTPLREAWENAKQSEKDAKDAKDTAETAWTQAQSATSSANTNFSSILMPAYNAAQSKLRTAAEKVKLDPESTSLEADADKLIAAADKRIKVLDADIAKATPLQKAFTEASANYNAKVTANAAADKQLQQKTIEYADAKASLDAIGNVECADLRLQDSNDDPAEVAGLKKQASDLKDRFLQWYNHALENRRKREEAQAVLDASKADEQRIRALLSAYSPESVKSIEEELTLCKDRYTAAESRRNDCRSQQKQHRLLGRDWQGLDKAAVMQLKLQADSGYQAAAQRIGAIKAELSTIAANRQTAQLLQQQIAANEQQLEVLKAVCNDFGNDNFSRAVQNYLLGELLGFANEYLSHFTKRYELFVQDKSTAILVKDTYCGGIARSVDMLSGGESFMISLSLALGLIRMGSSTFRVETLFIDEGFGTLDANSLELVISTLEKLQQLSGRQVGIISHVDELRKRIGLRIAVSRKAGSSGISEVCIEEGRTV